MELIEQALGNRNESPTAIMVEILSEIGESPKQYTRAEIFKAASAVICLVLSIRSNFDTGSPLQVAIFMDNSVEWLVAYIALLASNAIMVPIPLGFSREQAANLLKGVNVCLVDNIGSTKIASWNIDFRVIKVDVPSLITSDANSTFDLPLKDDVKAIIHTSGTTSMPKGVKIRGNAIARQISCLKSSIKPGTFERYCPLAPLSLLSEIIPISIALSTGGKVIFLPPETPLLGNPDSSAKDLLSHLQRANPSAVILPPSLVKEIDASCQNNKDRTTVELSQQLFGILEVPFLVCGGAPISSDILERLAAHGLPIYQAYGLSENTSVVSINLPGANKYGTVGKPLEHITVKLSEEGELLLKSESLFVGYTNNDPTSCYLDKNGYLHTGDLAQIDCDGFITITGRKKKVAITGDARNLSLDWIEREYKSLPFVKEAVIFAESLAKPVGFFILEEAENVHDARERIKTFGTEHFSEVERANVIFVVSRSDENYSTYFNEEGEPDRETIWGHLRLKL